IKEVMLQTPELPSPLPWAEGVAWGTMLTHAATVASFGYFVYLALLFAVGIAAILCVTPPQRTPPEAAGTAGQAAIVFATRRKVILRVTFPIAAVLAVVWHVWFHDRPEESPLADAVFGAYAVALFAAGVAAVIYAAPAPCIIHRDRIPPLAPLPSGK